SASGDDPQDAQSLLLPVTFPIIIGFVITMQAARSPETSIALWGSIIPFTSPIVMMGRIGYGVPEVVNYWELALSMVLLVGGIFFNIWLSAKIYRSGILMYGKKFSFKEIGKIIFRKS
ncbi:MAG: ABC transporter permease, partial [Alphaproteobacteria bacterium]|nr:ABC transporter permease [Alphaproteobacteria bacterium]